MYVWAKDGCVCSSKWRSVGIKHVTATSEKLPWDIFMIKKGWKKIQPNNNIHLSQKPYPYPQSSVCILQSYCIFWYLHLYYWYCLRWDSNTSCVGLKIIRTCISTFKNTHEYAKNWSIYLQLYFCWERLRRLVSLDKHRLLKFTCVFLCMLFDEFLYGWLWSMYSSLSLPPETDFMKLGFPSLSPLIHLILVKAVVWVGWFDEFQYWFVKNTMGLKPVLEFFSLSGD